MTRQFSHRFCARFLWLPFRNDSGQTIPPYSVVMAAGWSMASTDPDETDPSRILSFILATQPDGSQGPAAHYLTDAVSVPAGAFGRCARPLESPMLATVDGTPRDLSNGGFALVGPASGSWTLQAGMPGFLLTGNPEGRLGLVVCGQGPYAGTLAEDIPSRKKGKVNVLDASGSDGASTGQSIAAFNPYADLASGQRVTFDWVVSGWELIAADPCAG